MKDLISRQAAIDAIQKLNIPEDMCVFEIVSHIEVEISTLPSAEPKIIFCKDCYYRYGRYCHYRYTNGLFISADHYCGFAKRQEDDK